MTGIDGAVSDTPKNDRVFVMEGLCQPARLASRGWFFEMAAYLTIASILLSWVALYNGAPLVFSDTISYALAAYEGQVPGMYSMFYSLFILPLHWGVSFWPIVFGQGGIIAHLLYLTARFTLPGISPAIMLLVIAGLCVFSSLPWITGEILPDVFTPVVLLGIFLLAWGDDRLSRPEMLYVGILTTFAISTHLSHAPIAIGLIVLALLIRVFVFRDQIRIGRLALMLTAPVAIALTLMMGVNWLSSKQLVLARNGNVFLLAKWIEEGPALSYLQGACPESDYALCAHLDELKDASHDYLKWGENSPFQKVGGFDALEPEARTIVRRTLFAYPDDILQYMVLDIGRQLTRFGAGDGLSPDFAGMVAEQVSRVFGPSVGSTFVSSKQGRDLLPIDSFRSLHLLGLAAGATLCVLALLTRRGELPRELIALYAFIFLGVLWNAAITGGLSGAYDRYLARVIWLVCFAGLLTVIRLHRLHKQKAAHF